MVLLFATVNRVSLPILAMKLLPIPAFTSEVFLAFDLIIYENSGELASDLIHLLKPLKMWALIIMMQELGTCFLHDKFSLTIL